MTNIQSDIISMGYRLRQIVRRNHIPAPLAGSVGKPIKISLTCYKVLIKSPKKTRRDPQACIGRNVLVEKIDIASKLSIQTTHRFVFPFNGCGHSESCAKFQEIEISFEPAIEPKAHCGINCSSSHNRKCSKGSATFESL